MDGALRLLLMAALTLLVSAQTFNNYNNLPDLYKTHINKALKKANSIFGGGYHVAFHSLITTPTTMMSKLNVNVLLMVTTCKKASKDAYEHRDECNIQRKVTPWIDCLVCMTNNDKEQVDCATVRDVNQKKRDTFRSNCRKYNIGGGSMLSLKSEDKQFGCLGCV